MKNLKDMSSKKVLLLVLIFLVTVGITFFLDRLNVGIGEEPTIDIVTLEDNPQGNLEHFFVSKDGQNFYYIAWVKKEEGTQQFLTFNGEKHKEYDRIKEPIGLSQNREHIIYHAIKDDYDIIVVDGEEVRRWPKIVEAPKFPSRFTYDVGNDGRAVYAYRGKNGKTEVFEEKRSKGEHDTVGYLGLASDHATIEYVVQEANKIVWRRGENILESYSIPNNFTLRGATLSSDGENIAYWGWVLPNKITVYLNGEKEAEHLGNTNVEGLEFIAGTNKVVYSARNKLFTCYECKDQFVVIDGQKGESYSEILNLTVSSENIMYYAAEKPMDRFNDSQLILYYNGESKTMGDWIEGRSPGPIKNSESVFVTPYLTDKIGVVYVWEGEENYLIKQDNYISLPEGDPWWDGVASSGDNVAVLVYRDDQYILTVDGEIIDRGLGKIMNLNFNENNIRYGVVHNDSLWFITRSLSKDG